MKETTLAPPGSPSFRKEKAGVEATPGKQQLSVPVNA